MATIKRKHSKKQNNQGNQKPRDPAAGVSAGLSHFYFKYVKALEQNYKFDKFCTPLLNEADFHAKPMVLLIGQYSVGKTTFIKFLLERDFPGMRIGPEPTTDKFAAILHGMQERIIPGHAAAVDRTKPFQSLESFGTDFLNRFEVSECNAPILEHISLIDSPGILSGEKQRLNRGYDFVKVVAYWASRVDRILLLFDAHKLDISDEFRNAILALKGNSDKIRCVLNKADQVSQQQLMRVYGALLWSLGKVLNTPEVLRVYVSSFWDKPYKELDCAKLFDVEKTDLLADLKALPRSASIRRINEFVKRTRRAKVHAIIIRHLKEKFGWFGKTKTQDKIVGNMREMFTEISKKHNLAKGDFPNPDKFTKILKQFDIWKFPALKDKDLSIIDDILTNGIPKLLSSIQYGTDESKANEEGVGFNPFEVDEGPKVQAARGDWVVNSTLKAKFDEEFYSLQLTNGYAPGSQLKGVMLNKAAGLSNDVLAKIWDLSDIDKDGKMDNAEFALMMYLISYVKNGNTLPQVLPIRFIPPSKRHLLSEE